MAAMAGVNVDATGACDCTDNSTCPVGEYCEKLVGDCTGTGACAAIPMMCPAIFQPVCGCDGNTYNNDCEAAMAGVNVDSAGACIATCNNNTQCQAGEFCKKENAGGGFCAGQGLCEAIPLVCPLVFDPVCGCNGTTYNNECFAWMAGVNWDQTTTVPNMGCAGCTNNGQCAAGEFCQKANGDCGGFGNCMQIPTFCTFIFQPNCGCDGNFYSNYCVAHTAGVNVDYDAPSGSCP